MKRCFALLSILLVACSFVVAQAPGGGVAAMPSLTADQKVALYAQIHSLDKLEKQMSDLNQQFQTLQAQAKAQYEGLQQQQTKLKADLEAAQKKVLVDLNLDSGKYDLNLDTLTVSAKPETAKDSGKPAETVARK
jgi:DNA repair ATPase RecN